MPRFNQSVPDSVFLQEMKKNVNWDFVPWRQQFLNRLTPQHQLSWEADMMNYDFALRLCPTGHGKSQHSTKDYSVYLSCEQPDTRTLLVSKTDRQASKFLREVRTTLEYNSKIIEYYGEIRDYNNSWNDHMIYVKRPQIHSDPTIEAIGVGGAITGGRFHRIICDDIIDDKNVKNPTVREDVKEWFYGTLMYRLEPNGHLFVIGTRKHERDLYNDLLTDPNWHTTVQAAFPDGKIPKHEFIYSKEGKIKEIKILEATKVLWPERWPAEQLLARYALNAPMFLREQMNDTTLLKGRMLPSDWYQYYSKEDIEDKNLSIYIGVDLCAWDELLSNPKTADYFSLFVLGLDREEYKYYGLDIHRGRYEFPKQKEMIYKYYKKWNPIFIGIESVTAQRYMPQQLREEHKSTEMESTIHQIPAKGSKVERIAGHTPIFQHGRFFIPQPDERRILGTDTDWTAFENEWIMFPDGEHDDLIDSLEISIRTSQLGGTFDLIDEELLEAYF